MTTLSKRTLTHLEQLEADSIHIMREVVAETDNPVMLYSIGKDSSVLLHLARKAFYPAKIPFPILHVDTTWKFREMIEFRDQLAKDYDLDLLVHINQDGVKQNVGPFSHGSAVHTDIMKTQALKQALDKYQFDAAFGGARRDEEKSRAKERIFRFVQLNIVGILKISALNYGRFIILKRNLENPYACFPYPIGQNLMFGNIFTLKIYPWCHCISRQNARLYLEMVFGLWLMMIVWN